MVNSPAGCFPALLSFPHNFWHHYACLVPIAMVSVGPGAVGAVKVWLFAVCSFPPSRRRVLGRCVTEQHDLLARPALPTGLGQPWANCFISAPYPVLRNPFCLSGSLWALYESCARSTRLPYREGTRALCGVCAWGSCEAAAGGGSAWGTRTRSAWGGFWLQGVGS